MSHLISEKSQNLTKSDSLIIVFAEIH